MLDKEHLDQIAKELHRWEAETVAPSLARFPERADSFETSAGPTARLYTPLDGAGLNYLDDLGFPGKYPYTRGVQPLMYRSRLWTMRQYAGFGTAEETNRKFRFLLSQGQMGLSVAFDLPTQIGYDSDDPHAEGEVGQAGVAIDSLCDMEALFDGIPLDRVSISMTINAPAAVLLAMLIAAAEKQGVLVAKLQGTTQNDILKEYLARGTYIFPLRPSLRLAADLITYAAREVPKWNSISVSGYHIRDAGATAVQEMAFALANAVTYIEAVRERGLEVDEFAPRISWIFNTQNNFFEEIAKYRALRRMWARLLRERFGARDPRSWMFRTHVQTGGATLTAQQPLNNIVRAAFQALATVLGGVQSLALSCYDEALALPTDEAQQIALRTQQIIAYETGVTDTVDPLAGSYFVEYLTNELERRAMQYLDRIEAMGGMVAAIEAGYVQREIQESAYAWQRAVESGEKVIVGVNRFMAEQEAQNGVPGPRAPVVRVFHVPPAVAEAQIGRLNRLRAERDSAAVEAALGRLRQAAAGDDNLLPPILDAVKVYATLGEICGTLRAVFGEYQEFAFVH